MSLKRRVWNLLQFVLRFTNTDWVRNLFAQFSIFLPVSDRRWRLAQKYESKHWQLPPAPERDQFALPSVFLSEQAKARFIIETAVNVTGFDIESLSKKDLLIDIACGPCSIVAELAGKSRKIGIDPSPYPDWILERYEMLGFEIIKAPLESANLKSLGENENLNIAVLMYNALQHFQDIDIAISKIYNALGQHLLFFTDYASVPADRAHPQILTAPRLTDAFNRAGYKVSTMQVVKARLPGLVETPAGTAINIVCGIALKT
jgi:hypothetical protein